MMRIFNKNIGGIYNSRIINKPFTKFDLAVGNN
jgi:hypothetical protein